MHSIKGCGKYCGDLVQDCDEWSCFQCAHDYYPKGSIVDLQLDAADAEQTGVADGERPVAHRSARLLNPMPGTTRFNEERWWDKSKTVIYHLDQGKKVRGISEIVGQGPRQIRVVRERLHDLRTAELELVGAR